MPQLLHNDWTGFKARLQYRGGTSPDPAKFFLCLADSNLLTRSSPKAQFFAAELKQQNGYQRANLTFASDGSYSNVNQRHEMPELTATFSAVGAAIQYQTAFLVANGHPNAPKAFASADIDAASNVVTIAAHGLSSGDDIMIEADAGSVMPSGLVAGTLYKAIGASTNNFQFSADGATPIDIGAGSGTFRLRYANGIIHSLITEDAQLINGGRSGDIYLRLAESNQAYGVGV